VICYLSTVLCQLLSSLESRQRRVACPEQCMGLVAGFGSHFQPLQAAIAADGLKATGRIRQLAEARIGVDFRSLGGVLQAMVLLLAVR
jgi:hypothetical protein